MTASMFSSFRQLLPELRIEILSRILELERISTYVSIYASDIFKKLEYNKKDLWYLLYLYDTDFAEYVRSPEGIRKYVDCIKIKFIHYGKTQFHITKIFGKFHSFNDEPALIEYNKDEVLEETWFYNHMRHRGGDKPARINYKAMIIAWRYMDGGHRDDKNKYSIIQIDSYSKSIMWDQYHEGHFLCGGHCSINNPDKYASEIFDYISKEKIEDYIKSRRG